MNKKPDRAWRFVHPDLSSGKEQPGMVVGPRGKIEMVSENEAVRQSILLLLSTIPGERLMHPEYGSNLYRLIFSSNDDTTAGLAIHYVEQAIRRYEPRVEVLRVDANRDPEHPEGLMIQLNYRVRATQNAQSLVFSMNLAEGEVV
jgi:hypothetical protein